MDHKFQITNFDLPKSPASTLREDESDADDDVEFMGTIEAPRSTIVPNWHTMPLLLSTPPLSPLDMGQQQQQQQPNMPLLTAMLSQNYPGLAPTSYVISIPCFLCKQPFHDVEQLRQHLTMHAIQFNSQVQRPEAPLMAPPMASPLPPPMASPLPPPLPPPPAAVEMNRFNVGLTGFMPGPDVTPPAITAPLAPPPVITAPVVTVPIGTASLIPAAYDTNMQFRCKHNGKVMKSLVSLRTHLNHHVAPVDTNDKWWARKQFRCHICKKSYRREGFLQKHMYYKHGEHLALVSTTAETPPPPPPVPLRPAAMPLPSPPAIVETDQKKRVVWSTKLLNAVAAANYSPATETSSKYVPPTDCGNQQLDSCLKPPPKQKYPPRSPYFNPNLWVDNDTYV